VSHVISGKEYWEIKNFERYTHIQRANSRLKKERDREKPSIDLGGKGPGAKDNFDRWSWRSQWKEKKKPGFEFARKSTRSEEEAREERGGVRRVFTRSESINRHVARVHTYLPAIIA